MATKCFIVISDTLTHTEQYQKLHNNRAWES